MALILSILMLGALALSAGAVVLWRRGDRRKAGLMAVAALVVAGNVALLTVPLGDGRSPATAAP
jgi:hypothetical protein